MAAVVPSFKRFSIAIECVERLLRTITQALDAAGIRYEVTGDHAVAAWVASKDADATRTTKDVDLLLDRSDLARVDDAVRDAGFFLDTVGEQAALLEKADPVPSRGVHILFAGEKVRPPDAHPAPTLDAAVVAEAGYRVVDLASLLTMKLTAFRRHDQVHVEDMIRVGLVTPEIRAKIPTDLLPRLEEIERTLPDWH